MKAILLREAGNIDVMTTVWVVEDDKAEEYAKGLWVSLIESTDFFDGDAVDQPKEVFLDNIRGMTLEELGEYMFCEMDVFNTRIHVVPVEELAPGEAPTTTPRYRSLD